MKKNIKDISKTFLSFMVIFQMAFSMVGAPVVAMAFEGDAPKVVTEEKKEITETPKVEKEETQDVEIKETPEVSVEVKDETDETVSDTSTSDSESKEEATSTDTETTDTGATTTTTEEAPAPSADEEAPVLFIAPKVTSIKGQEVEACEITGPNLVSNGGFESPTISSSEGWDIYPNGTSGMAWTVLWNGSFAGAPATANLELQNGNLWTPYEGDQYTELDSDWDGHANTVNNEQASTKISQTITTIPGKTYEVKFAFSARPGTSMATNHLAFYIDNVLWDGSTTSDGTSFSDTNWIVRTYTFTASGTSTTLSFADTGTADSFGTFLDDVQAHRCADDVPPPVCEAMTLYARIKLSNVSNIGAGNTAPKIFVGGNVDLPHGSGGNVYDPNEWFPLIDGNGDFINDADISGYRDVPGVAIQRMNGKVRLVVYGFHENPQTNRERVQGSIELSTDGINRLTGAWTKGNGYVDPLDSYTRVHDASVNDAANPMDARGTFTGQINQNNERWDNVRVLNDLFQFTLVVTSGSDGFYAQYDFDNTPADEDCNPTCDNEKCPPTCEETEEGCDNGGGCTEDCDTGCTGEDCDTECTEDCDTNGGPTDNSSGGGGSSGGGSSRQGEVLGASIGPVCYHFTEYHDLGDTGGEIPAIQEFLNDYMDAGLTVNGVYDQATKLAVHKYQAKHWDEIIDPWNPPLSPNTTGRWRQTTISTTNTILGCPSGQVYLEDPKIVYEVTEVKNMNLNFDPTLVLNALSQIQTLAFGN